MKEFLLNPGIFAGLVTLVTAIPVLINYLIKRKDHYRDSKLSLDEKRTRLLYWYQEYYHRARRAVIDKGGDPDQMGLPFEPEDHLLHKGKEEVK